MPSVATEGTAQPADRIQGVEDLKGVLKRIAPATIHRGIDLNVSPGEHQNRGPEALDALEQDGFDIQERHSRQIENLLRQLRELLVQVICQVNGADRKNWIAGEPHEQHPLISWR